MRQPLVEKGPIKYSHQNLGAKVPCEDCVANVFSGGIAWETWAVAIIEGKALCISHIRLYRSLHGDNFGRIEIPEDL